MPRNPCIEPKPGDVVKSAEGKSRERHVTACETFGAGVMVYYRSPTVTFQGAVRSCWITTWQEWCRKTQAVVVKVAK